MMENMMENKSEKPYMRDIATLEKYLEDDKCYCREERQYALFLYNFFLEAKRCGKRDSVLWKHLEKWLGEDAEAILQVFYEATIMRDYQCQDRQVFNNSLCKFCCLSDETVGRMKEKAIDEYHLGVKGAVDKYKDIADGDVRIKIKLDIVKYMMNAKPDIFVLYKTKKGICCAKMLECKDESKEGKYTDILGSETIPQCLIQECIMAFLFGKNTVPDCKTLLPVPDKSSKWKTEPKKGKDDDIVEINWNDYVETFQEIFENAPKEGCIENRGVQMVQFKNEDEENKKDGVITIRKKTLVETAYKKI